MKILREVAHSAMLIFIILPIFYFAYVGDWVIISRLKDSMVLAFIGILMVEIIFQKKGEKK